MEGSSNEQGGDSLTNDWRTYHEPGLREWVIYEIVKKLKKCCHQPSNENDIKKAAIKYEAKIYGMAKDKDAYLGKICRKVFSSHSPFRAQVLNQEQSLPTSTSQQWLPQANIQINLNSPESSGSPTQVPLSVSAAHNRNIQMGEEGVHSNKLPGQPQREIQQLLPQAQHQQSLLKETIQQQLPHHNTSLPIIEQSSPQSSGQPNSQMAVKQLEREIQQLESENLIDELMNGQDTQKNHDLASPQNKGEEQEQTTPSCNVHGPSLLGTKGQEVEQSQPLMLQHLYDVDDWREETYQKIKVLKEKYGVVLSTFFKSISDKLREIDSLRQQNMPVEWLTASKATLEQVLAFLNVCKSSVSEFHRDKFSLHEEKVLRFIEYHHLNVTRRTMKQQQVYLPPSHTHQTRPRMEPEDENSPMSTAAQEHLPPEPITERPIDRLIKAIQSASPESLAQSVSEMRSVISLSEMIAGLVNTIGGSRARLVEDLSERTRFRAQQGDTNHTKRFKRSVTAISSSKVNKIEPSYALLQEIMEINGRLVETVVSICNEDVCPSEVTSGTVVVTCDYVPVAVSATFKALYNSGYISQIQPLRLLVPENYPSSPILLEKVIFDTASDHKFEDLSARARSRFSLSMKEAMSLKEIAKVWDECARATMLEYAERHGGGTFSSKYGRWESVLA
ncbi:hypothetical protein BRARA_I00348 [Brassica rapa]|uniref:Mediator complex subunit 15 KIX domain-containing protein n=1 Tax=Brassica campestris TaxID=3711 RepID=A0A397XQK8_BRACM|nr:hypothetical protein BRARA_I00348 [Brassica rapa]